MSTCWPSLAEELSYLDIDPLLMIEKLELVDQDTFRHPFPSAFWSSEVMKSRG